LVFKIEQEQLLWKVGEFLAEQGKPLGFLNSEGFNPSFSVSGTQLELLIAKMRAQALSDLPFEIGSSKKFEDLRFALWLLANTYCYVVTSPHKSKELQGFNLGKQDVRFGSLALPLLESAVDVTDRQKTSLSKIYKEFGETLNQGLLAFPTISMSKGKLSFPRKKVSFVEGEYVVLPVSVVNGYVSKLKEKSKYGIVTIDAHRVGGSLREFNMTADTSVAVQLYTGSLLLEDFETVGYSLSAASVYQESKVKIMKGLTRLLLTFYDLGIAEGDYPQRQLSLSRIRKVTYLAKEEQDKKIRQLKRYALMSEDAMVRQIIHLAKDWSFERQTEFLVESLARLKRVSDVDTSSNRFEVKSLIEFQMRFSECIEYYSTAYLRVVYDMIQEEPERYNFITGRSTDLTDLNDGAVSSEPVAIPDELEF
jgi:hypothetical protein